MNVLNKPLFAATALALALSGCNLAPKYEQPQVELPSAQFKYTADEPGAVQAASLGWQDYFADPRLHRLIELALKNNTDLRTANLNVEQVRAQYAIQRSERLPGISGSAGAGRSGTGNPSLVRNSYNIGLGISGFELDLWGKVRNQSQAALQSYFATAAARDATHLSLISSVAKAHFNEIYAAESMKLAERTLASRQETYRLAQLRHKAGVISALELRQQETMIEQAKSSYAGAVRAREQARNGLELLISQALPADLPAALPLDKQFAVRNLPAGLPSDLLLNRPDIRAAEHNLRQANANIGAARAAFFPSISLTGTLGYGSSELGNLLQSANRVWNTGASLAVPIFDWGRLKGNLDAAKIAGQKTVVAYEAAVETAFNDVANALVARAALGSQHESNVIQNKAAAETLRLTRLRYRHGVSSALDLLDAERGSYGAASAVLASELSLMENLADLYKVLGGGLKRHTQDDPALRAQLEAAKAAQQVQAQSQAASQTAAE